MNEERFAQLQRIAEDMDMCLQKKFQVGGDGFTAQLIWFKDIRTCGAEEFQISLEDEDPESFRLEKFLRPFPKAFGNSFEPIWMRKDIWYGMPGINWDEYVWEGNKTILVLCLAGDGECKEKVSTILEITTDSKGRDLINERWEFKESYL